MRGWARKYNNIPTTVATSITFAVGAVGSGTMCSAGVVPPDSTAKAAQGDFASQVDIGGGRKLYLECHGSGSPTVILESGYHDSSQPWSLADGYPPAVVARIAAPSQGSVPTIAQGPSFIPIRLVLPTVAAR